MLDSTHTLAHFVVPHREIRHLESTSRPASVRLAAFGGAHYLPHTCMAEQVRMHRRWFTCPAVARDAQRYDAHDPHQTVWVIPDRLAPGTPCRRIANGDDPLREPWTGCFATLSGDPLDLEPAASNANCRCGRLVAG